MSEYFYEGDHTEAALPLQDTVGQRKRTRTDEEENAVLSYSRHVPPHARVRVICGAFSSLLSVRGHVLDGHGGFNAAEFPGLAFFYQPSVAAVESGTVVLHFPDNSTAGEVIAHYTRRQPCPVHGPFRCPCYVMHEVAGSIRQLLREIFCQHFPFEVTIDSERSYPHLRIDSASQTWSALLVGLPLPPRTFGPFPLGGVASPQSITHHWSQYSQKSKLAEDACVLCLTATTMHCASCACRICDRCAEKCGSCESRVCHGCSAVDESGMTICYRCAR